MPEKKIVWTKWRDPAGRLLKNIKYGLVPFNSSTGQIPIPKDEPRCWIGETNFPISHPVAVMIESTAGVNAFEVIRPYTFRIAIGGAFDSRDVRANIESLLRGKPVSEHLRECLSCFPYWAVITRDGCYDYYVGQTRTQVEDQIVDINGGADTVSYSWETSQENQLRGV